MAPVEAWTGTPYEVDFVPLYIHEIYKLFLKREGASKGFFFPVVRDKNGEALEASVTFTLFFFHPLRTDY
jgi:hypothetical protein